ncbi:acetyltransferase [Anaerovorax odorimutans]|uniref:acetyltransferase n=1 Tax=Anaerovorax odorimutans TaxID=109327 RepID=UPI00042482F3|nr:acetyltransferase [Anaerovorax odorimutans]
MKIIILGAGGNSKVILDIILARKLILKEDLEILGFLDDDINKKEIKGYPILGMIDDIVKYKNDSNVSVIDGIGSNVVRKKIYDKYKGIKWQSVIHPSAIIGSGVEIKEGTVVMPGAIINADSKIGKKTIINTGAIVEHDNRIGDFVHLASGVTTAGNVTVGDVTMLGTGTKVIQGIKIGENTMIGAGAVVVSDIPHNVTAIGIPAKAI